MNKLDNGKFYALLAVGFAIVLLLIVNVVAIVVIPRAAVPHAIAGIDGRDAVVDYAKIETILQEKVQVAVEALPKPVDGRDGKDGVQGPAGPAGAKGDKGEKGDKGDSAICRQLEVRDNPLDGLAEYRFVGDEIWLVAPDDGKLPNTCELSDATGFTDGSL